MVATSLSWKYRNCWAAHWHSRARAAVRAERREQSGDRQTEIGEQLVDRLLEFGFALGRSR